MKDTGRTTECLVCRGTGQSNDVRHASITHRRTVTTRPCKWCKGTGRVAVLEPVPTTKAETATDAPAWMLDY
jgi:DnaJ-class molecular chaperone